MSLFHYMALATPSAWARLLARNAGRTKAIHWPRVVLSVCVSLAVFVVTLPERAVLACVLRRRFAGERPVFEHEPGVVVILGYYRSGTTHLHNLLSCDRRFITPRWVQAMTPHGFWLSWTWLRCVLTPAMPNTRPQDEVAFGPSWPAEDDFACNNWALASSLPGRLMYPGDYEHYSRWHYLEGLTEGELARWRRVQAIFSWKVTRAKPGRALLLKTPSHMARVAELRRLYADRVRFIHIHRDREDVIRSNLAMAHRLRTFLLEPLPGDDVLRARIEEELSRTDTTMRAQSADLDETRLAHIAFDDIVADPIATLRHAYDALGLGWTRDVEASMRRYLDEVGRYVPRSGAQEPTTRKQPTASRLSIALALASTAAALLAGAAFASAWIWVAHLTTDRNDMLAWPLGFIVGLAALWTARRGDRRLGLLACGVFLICDLAVMYALPEATYGWIDEHRWKAMRTAHSEPHGYLWLLFGALTAYRCASRRHVRPPG